MRCFERCHALAARGALRNRHLLSTIGAHLLSVIGYLQSAPRFDRRIDELIERAHALISLGCRNASVSQQLPSTRRELFASAAESTKDRPSPKQYHSQVRLQKAQELLASTTRSVQEIADILGFHSAFQLSKQSRSISDRRRSTGAQSTSKLPRGPAILVQTSHG